MNKVFEALKNLASLVAQIQWLKDLCPTALKKWWRRVRIGLWKRGSYRELLSAQHRKGKKVLHYLHIGKTGGTAVHEAIKDNRDTESYHVLITPHPFTLSDVPRGEPVAFVLRDPIRRFISGFNNRFSEGRPSYVQPWTRQERIAFQRFPTANQLALGIASEDPETRRNAIRAMRDIEHVNASYTYWLKSVAYLQSRKQDIVFVGLLENLDQDFSEFVSVAGMPDGLELPKEDSRVNRTRKSAKSELDEQAEANLRQWYSEDYEIYEFCRELWEEQRLRSDHHQPELSSR